MKNTIKVILGAALTFAMAVCGHQIAAAQVKGGYTNLFDGKTLKGWKRLAGTADYKVENGAIVGTTVAGSGNTFLVNEKVLPDPATVVPTMAPF